MNTTRMEAFTDGVIAILITVMVLELHDPKGSSWHDLRTVIPTLLIYLLSFVYIGIYWNNHHHMLQLTERVNGSILWANLHLLFWLSLIPVATKWLGTSDFATVPVAVYGIVLLLCGCAYSVLAFFIVREQGPGSALAQAFGRDRKGRASVLLYAVGIVLAVVNRWAGLAVFTAVALMWFIPDRRVDAVIRREDDVSNR